MARTKGGVFYPAIFGSLRENNGSTDSSRPRHDLASLNSLLGVTQREQYFTGSYGGMGSGTPPLRRDVFRVQAVWPPRDPRRFLIYFSFFGRALLSE